MHFIINNPYRILGLTANASSREVAKRVADLETFAEFGKIKKYHLIITMAKDELVGWYHICS